MLRVEEVIVTGSGGRYEDRGNSNAFERHPGNAFRCEVMCISRCNRAGHGSFCKRDSILYVRGTRTFLCSLRGRGAKVGVGTAVYSVLGGGCFVSLRGGFIRRRKCSHGVTGLHVVRGDFVKGLPVHCLARLRMSVFLHSVARCSGDAVNGMCLRLGLTFQRTFGRRVASRGVVLSDDLGYPGSGGPSGGIGSLAGIRRTGFIDFLRGCAKRRGQGGCDGRLVVRLLAKVEVKRVGTLAPRYVSFRGNVVRIGSAITQSRGCERFVGGNAGASTNIESIPVAGTVGPVLQDTLGGQISGSLGLVFCSVRGSKVVDAGRIGYFFGEIYRGYKVRGEKRRTLERAFTAHYVRTGVPTMMLGG